MEKIAERKNKVVYRDGDRAVKVFDKEFKNQTSSTKF